MVSDGGSCPAAQVLAWHNNRLLTDLLQGHVAAIREGMGHQAWGQQLWFDCCGLIASQLRCVRVVSKEPTGRLVTSIRTSPEQ